MTSHVLGPFAFTFEDKVISGDYYGTGYLEELREAATRALASGGSILEWGSGISTLMLANLVNTLNERPLVTPRMRAQIVTIDNNEPYLHAVLAAMPDKLNVLAVACSLSGPCHDQLDLPLGYATVPFALAHPAPWKLIVIDGRRRMECALMAAMLANDDTIIMLHDYRRLRYQPVLGLYDIVADQPQYRAMRVSTKTRLTLAQGRTAMFDAHLDDDLRAKALAGIKILCG